MPYLNEPLKLFAKMQHQVTNLLVTVSTRRSVYYTESPQDWADKNQ